jgi:hypothetical protein
VKVGRVELTEGEGDNPIPSHGGEVGEVVDRGIARCSHQGLRLSVEDRVENLVNIDAPILSSNEGLGHVVSIDGDVIPCRGHANCRWCRKMMMIDGRGKREREREREDGDDDELFGGGWWGGWLKVEENPWGVRTHAGPRGFGQRTSNRSTSAP